MIPKHLCNVEGMEIRVQDASTESPHVSEMVYEPHWTRSGGTDLISVTLCTPATTLATS